MPSGQRLTTDPDRALWVSQNLYQKGYNTNYMTTWFFSRTAPKLTSTTTGGTLTLSYELAAAGPPPVNQIKGLSGSRGGLTRNFLDSSFHSSSVVPLMADANVGDQREAFLRSDIANIDGTVGLPSGMRTVESFSDGPHERVAAATRLQIWGRGAGPVQVHQVTLATGVVAPGSVYVQEQGDNVNAALPNTARGHLQDYRDIGPVHGGGKGGSANVLFADGSIKSFTDTTGDGYLNPGFDVSAATNFDGTGYASSVNELPEAQIFSGVFLEKFSSFKTNLDQ